MAERNKGRVHIAGNVVLDVLARDVEEVREPARDGWGANVQLLKQPIETVLGGNGAAVAYVLGRLGQPVRLTTNLGMDSWGTLLHNWLCEGGVEVGKTEALATAVHFIALNSEGKRRSYYYAGEKVAWEQALEGERCAWFFAAGYGLADAEDLVKLKSIFATMRERGAKTVFDPSPWFFGRVERKAMLELWRQTDCLLATEEELSVWQEADDVRQLAECIVQLGPEIVVVKRGGEGAVYASRLEGSGTIATKRVEAANTVGAGDSFNGRLLCGLARGEKLSEAVSGAVALATRVVRNGRGVLGALD